jgi:O-antigen ligase
MAITSGLTPAFTPGTASAGSFGQPRGLLRFVEGLYVCAVAQTVLFNPVLLTVGSLRLYACGVTWVVVGFASALLWLVTDDEVLRSANTRLAIVVWVALAAIGVQLLVMGLQVFTVGSLIRLLYAPLGVFAAFAVYRRIERILDITLGLVGLECVLLVLPRLGAPVDLSNRLNPAALGGRNDFGAFLMTLIVLRISIWAYTRQRPPLYVLGGLGSSLIALIFTLARSPLLGLVVGLVCVSLSSMWRRGITGRSLRSAGIVVAVVSPVLFQPAPRERLTSASLANSSGRSDLWDAALELFSRRPVFGHGFGSYNVTSPHVIEDFVTSAKFGPVIPGLGQPTSSAHNVVLQVLAEGGIVGMAVVSWCVAYLLRGCWHALLLPVVVAIFVDSLFDTFAYVVQVSWVLGLVFAIGLRYRSPDDGDSSIAGDRSALRPDDARATGG